MKSIEIVCGEVRMLLLRWCFACIEFATLGYRLANDIEQAHQAIIHLFRLCMTTAVCHEDKQVFTDFQELALAFARLHVNVDNTVSILFVYLCEII